MTKVKFQYQVKVWKEATFEGTDDDVQALKEALSKGDIEQAIDIADDRDGEFITFLETEQPIDGTLHL